MKKSQILILVLSAVLLVAASVFGTLAYLTSQDKVINTFTVGQVDIIVDEAKVNPDGTVVTGADRVKSNEYHLVPGMTYTKDPTMTVVKNSEDSYVRMLVTINCLQSFDAIYSPDKADLTTIFNEYDNTEWIYRSTIRNTTDNTVTYEFRYKDIVRNSDDDTVLPPLFESITVPSSFNSEDMKAIEDLEITVVGHAIQAIGFDNADEAWTAFADEIG